MLRAAYGTLLLWLLLAIGSCPSNDPSDDDDDDVADDDTGDDDTGDDDTIDIEVTFTELHLNIHDWALEGIWEATFPYAPVDTATALQVAQDYYAQHIALYPHHSCGLWFDEQELLSCYLSPVDWGGHVLVDRLSGEVVYAGELTWGAGGARQFPGSLDPLDQSEMACPGTTLVADRVFIHSTASSWTCSAEAVAEWVLQSQYIHDRHADDEIDLCKGDGPKKSTNCVTCIRSRSRTHGVS